MHYGLPSVFNEGAWYGSVCKNQPTDPRRPPLNSKQLTILQTKLKRALDDEALTKIARTTGFTERIRSITPAGLAMAFIYAMAGRETETLADVLRSFNALTDNTVQYKPFHNQLAKKAFPEFMRGTLCHLLQHLVVQVLKALPSNALSAFEDVVIQDGSSFALLDALQGAFPGRFTAVSPAAVEVHATMSLFRDQAISISIAPDTQGERDFLPEPKTLRGKLFLGDRGYEDKDYCAAIDKEGGFFVVRCKKGLNPLVRMCWVNGSTPRALRDQSFKEIVGKLRGKDADLDVEWPRKKGVGTLRLVLIWNAKHESHMLLLTNLARGSFPPHLVRKLYRLRWQVELLFKEWKSYANLHAFRTGKEGIALGLIWASLAASLFKRFLAHATQLVYSGIETSTRRTAMALNFHLPALLRGALHAGPDLARAFREILEYLSTEARRAHPKRDRASGRLQAGLQPVHAASGSEG